MAGTSVSYLGTHGQISAIERFTPIDHMTIDVKPTSCGKRNLTCACHRNSSQCCGENPPTYPRFFCMSYKSPSSLIAWLHDHPQPSPIKAQNTCDTSIVPLPNDEKISKPADTVNESKASVITHFSHVFKKCSETPYHNPPPAPQQVYLYDVAIDFPTTMGWLCTTLTSPLA